MACVAMDTSFPDSDQAIRLGRRLGLRLAWCHALRLWSWGIDQNREDGTLHLDAERIAEVASWRGDADEFVAAMVEVGLLKELPDGGYYMSGWSRNKDYFSKKRRMKKYRAAKKIPLDTPIDTSLDTSSEASPETSKETHKVTSLETSQVTDSLSLSLSLLNTQTDTRASATKDATKASPPETSITADQFETILSSPPYSWKPPKHSDRQRIAACCPVPIAVWRSALKIALGADKPGYPYFASVLESESKPKKSQRSKDAQIDDFVPQHLRPENDWSKQQRDTTVIAPTEEVT